jgi:hypothetical protein
MAAEEEESEGSDESSGEYESDSETASEESGRSPSPVARPRMSQSTPPIQAPSRHSAEQPFPSSTPSKQPLPPYTDPEAPPRAPSVATPGRIRKLSQSLRKSRSMTFGTARPTLSSNSAEAPPLPPPPVPPLPLSVAQSRSAASISARSKPIPPLPSSPSSSRGASSSRQAQPPLPHEAPAHKRYPTGQNVPQTPPRPKKKQTPGGGLKPPELKKMPELLPIFIEMVRCCSFLFLTIHHLTFDAFCRCGPH